LVEDLLHFDWAPCPSITEKAIMCHHLRLASYLQFENPNVLKHVINNNIEQTKLSFIV